MPLYEYRCKACGHTFEKIQTFSAPDEKECPVCKGEVERLISAPAVHFSGSGFYSTDYKASAAPSKPGGEGSSKENSANKGEGGKSEGSKDSSSSSSGDGAAKADAKPSSSTPAPAASSAPAPSSSPGKD